MHHRRHAQIFSLVFISLIATTSRNVVANEPAAAGKFSGGVIQWLVPKDFPTGLDTAIEGQWSGKERGLPAVAEFKTADGRTGIAQRIGRSDRYLWFTTINEADRGKEMQVKVQPVEAKPGVTIRKVDGGYEFFDGERKVLRYQQEPKSLKGRSQRANYVHPLFSLDGDELTQDFPPDHVHHRGIFWAWHQIYVGDRRAGDSWENKGLLTVVKEADVVDAGPVFATLKIVADWMSSEVTDEKGNPQPVVEEMTHIRVFRASKELQYVDFSIRLNPLGEKVRIGGSEDAKGYSGFTVRVRPPGEMAIVDENGRHAQDPIGTASRWADVSGKFGEGDAVSGIAILSHRSLPEFPPKWLLRHYGMQNVAYPGRHAVEFPADKPLLLRHRLLIHRGDKDEANIPAHQKAYEILP